MDCIVESQEESLGSFEVMAPDPWLPSQAGIAVFELLGHHLARADFQTADFLGGDIGIAESGDTVAPWTWLPWRPCRQWSDEVDVSFYTANAPVNKYTNEYLTLSCPSTCS